jgi:hypothetical protein
MFVLTNREWASADMGMATLSIQRLFRCGSAWGHPRYPRARGTFWFPQCRFNCCCAVGRPLAVSRQLCEPDHQIQCSV